MDKTLYVVMYAFDNNEIFEDSLYYSNEFRGVYETVEDAISAINKVYAETAQDSIVYHNVIKCDGKKEVYRERWDTNVDERYTHTHVFNVVKVKIGEAFTY